MAVSYKKLWHLLIDKDMKKTDLRKLAGIAPASLAKLSKGDTVTTDTLEKICKALNCDIADIMEFVPDNTKTYLQNMDVEQLENKSCGFCFHVTKDNDYIYE